MSNLSNLPHDVLIVIARQLKKLEDFVSFRCVSKSLFAAAKDEYFEGLRLRQRTPYLLLPVRDDCGNDDVHELYSLVEGESVVASVKVPRFNTKKCFESLGWLLAVEEDDRMSLVDPFSGTEIPLPHQETLPGFGQVDMDGYFFFQKMVISARPSETSNFVLMVICGGNIGLLAFWRPGDKAWNITNLREQRFVDVVYHGNGQFYAIGYPGNVWVFNFTSGNDYNAPGRIIMDCEPIVPVQSMGPPPVDHPMLYYANGTKNLYILKALDDTLLIITRISPYMCEDGSAYITTKFQVFEVDIKTSTWKEIHSLGRMAIFLGTNSTIAVDASRFSGGGLRIKPNHIYFTEDEWEFHYTWSPKGAGRDIGIYNLETGIVEPIYPGEPLFSRVSIPLWIIPCF